MKYSETGNFTTGQIKLAKNIAKNIKKLRDSGCVVLGKQDTLYAYLKDDYEHREESCFIADGYAIPNLDCGRIDDSGADDSEYFERGYITEK